jgi:hypothetical protein
MDYSDTLHAVKETVIGRYHVNDVKYAKYQNYQVNCIPKLKKEGLLSLDAAIHKSYREYFHAYLYYKDDSA